MKRKNSSDHQDLSLPGKLSLSLSNKIIKNNLTKGSWLDLLSGYNSPLQTSLSKDKKLTRLVSLDFNLNKNLKRHKIELNKSFLAKKISYAEASFDNITLNNGLEHLEHPQEILNECFRILKKKGVLQIVVPTWIAKPVLEFFAFKLHDQQAKEEADDHKMYYDEKTLWPMLIKAGFKPSKIILRRVKFYFSLYAKAIKE